MATKSRSYLQLLLSSIRLFCSGEQFLTIYPIHAVYNFACLNQDSLQLPPVQGNQNHLILQSCLWLQKFLSIPIIISNPTTIGTVVVVDYYCMKYSKSIVKRDSRGVRTHVSSGIQNVGISKLVKHCFSLFYHYSHWTIYLAIQCSQSIIHNALILALVGRELEACRQSRKPQRSTHSKIMSSYQENDGGISVHTKHFTLRWLHSEDCCLYPQDIKGYTITFIGLYIPQMSVYIQYVHQLWINYTAVRRILY